MFQLKTTYNGTPFSVMDAPDAFIKTQVVAHLEKRLQPFEGQISSAGGSIAIDFNDEGKSKLVYMDMPEELIGKIKQALSKK